MAILNEEIVSFENSQGDKLYGIVHIPDDDSQKSFGINILNPGIKNRVAPHRLNVKLARELARLGFYVLRFDPAGIGDSEGKIMGDTVPGIWRQIQEGLLVDDVLISNEYFRNKYQLEEIMLIGSCGGAITSILAAKIDVNINKLVIIDLPINFDTEDKQFSDNITSEREAGRLLDMYFRKLTRPKSLFRLFLLKSDYRSIFKSLILKLKSLLCIRKFNGAFQEIDFNPKFNYKFIDAFNAAMKRKSKILFIVAQNDPATGPFYEDFHDKYLLRNKKFFDHISIKEIKNANHIYALKQSQDDLIQVVKQFVQTTG